ncbi:MAG: hypothetical protein EOO66_12005 [Methylobacterium sp.]|nr:MAG: hypothetical protein EOO66_12005 [Methylobacterium sp.]
MPDLPNATRPFLEVPPVSVRVPTPPTIEVVEGGVTYPAPERPGTVIVETPDTPDTPDTPRVQRAQPLFVQPTPPAPTAPVVPVYPRKQARH